MRRILISINPLWVAKILSGEKTLEIRKTAPKCELPCEVYIYCTKDTNNKLCFIPATKQFYAYDKDFSIAKQCEQMGLTFNGKVVAKFTLNRTYTIHNFPYGYEMFVSNADIRKEREICQKACLTSDELRKYLPCDKERHGYAWEISDLVIFDKPKELKDFGVKRSPQSWQFCEVEE